jgi:hypothetical protein
VTLLTRLHLKTTFIRALSILEQKKLHQAEWGFEILQAYK